MADEFGEAVKAFNAGEEEEVIQKTQFVDAIQGEGTTVPDIKIPQPEPVEDEATTAIAEVETKNAQDLDKIDDSLGYGGAKYGRDEDLNAEEDAFDSTMSSIQSQDANFKRKNRIFDSNIPMAKRAKAVGDAMGSDNWLGWAIDEMKMRTWEGKVDTDFVDGNTIANVNGIISDYELDSKWFSELIKAKNPASQQRVIDVAFYESNAKKNINSVMTGSAEAGFTMVGYVGDVDSFFAPYKLAKMGKVINAITSWKGASVAQGVVESTRLYADDDYQVADAVISTAVATGVNFWIAGRAGQKYMNQIADDAELATSPLNAHATQTARNSKSDVTTWSTSPFDDVVTEVAPNRLKTRIEELRAKRNQTRQTFRQRNKLMTESEVKAIIKENRQAQRQLDELEELQQTRQDFELEREAKLNVRREKIRELVAKKTEGEAERKLTQKYAEIEKKVDARKKLLSQQRKAEVDEQKAIDDAEIKTQKVIDGELKMAERKQKIQALIDKKEGTKHASTIKKMIDDNKKAEEALEKAREVEAKAKAKVDAQRARIEGIAQKSDEQATLFRQARLEQHQLENRLAEIDPEIRDLLSKSDSEALELKVGNEISEQITDVVDEVEVKINDELQLETTGGKDQREFVEQAEIDIKGESNPVNAKLTDNGDGTHSLETPELVPVTDNMEDLEYNIKGWQAGLDDANKEVQKANYELDDAEAFAKDASREIGDAEKNLDTKAFDEAIEGDIDTFIKEYNALKNKGFKNLTPEEKVQYFKREAQIEYLELKEHYGDYVNRLEGALSDSKIARDNQLEYKKNIDDAQGRVRQLLEAKELGDMSHSQKLEKAIDNVQDMIKKQLDEFSYLGNLPSDKVDIDALTGIMDGTTKMSRADVKAYLSEYPDIKKALEEFDVVNAQKAEPKQVKWTTKGKLGTGLVIGMLGTSMLEAGDGSEGSSFGVTSTIALLIVASIIGVKGYKAIKTSNSGVKGIVANGATKMKSYYGQSKILNDPKNSVVNNTINNAVSSMRTRLTETLAPILKVNDPELSSFARDLLWDSLDGTKMSAEIDKRAIARRVEQAYRRVENDAYNSWLDKRAVGFVERNITGKMEDGMTYLDQFRKEVSHCLEFGCKDVNVQKASKALSEQFESIRVQAKDSKVFGFDNVEHNEKYFTRKWKLSGLRKAILHSDEARLKITKEVERMILTGKGKPQKDGSFIRYTQKEAQEQSEKMVEAMSVYDMKAQGGSLTDSAFARVEKELQNKGVEYDPDELAFKLSGKGDVTYRAMHRIEMDINSFQDIKIDGMDDLKVQDFFERDAYKMLQEYSNTMAGHIALAKKGYGSTKVLREKISKINDDYSRNVLENQVNLLLGRTLVDPTSGATAFVNDLRNVTFGAKLPLVMLSLPPEFFKVFGSAMATGHFGKAISELGNVFRKTPKESELYKQIADVTGIGTNMLRHDFDARNLSELDNMVETGSGAFSKIAVDLKNKVAIGSGLVGSTDVLQRIASVSNLTNLANHFKTGKGFNATRLKMYGITDDSKALLNDVLIMENGHLKAIDVAKMSQKQKDEMSNILFNMNQNLTQETTLGGTPMWMYNDNLGRALGFLMTFPLQAISNHGVRDIASGDVQGYTSMALMFSGAYLGTMARAELTGRDYTQEDLFTQALLNMPVMGIVSASGVAYDGYASPTTTMMSDLTNLSHTAKVLGDM